MQERTVRSLNEERTASVRLEVPQANEGQAFAIRSAEHVAENGNVDEGQAFKQLQKNATATKEKPSVGNGETQSALQERTVRSLNEERTASVRLEVPQANGERSEGNSAKKDKTKKKTGKKSPSAVSYKKGKITI